MRFVYFTHSLASCWNHGNAHFLRGVLRELIARGHQVIAYEPSNAWSLQNLHDDHGDAGLDPYRAVYPELDSWTYADFIDVEGPVSDADVVIVHEWNEPWLVAALGQKRRRGARYTLLFHDTHHRAVSDPEAIRKFDLDGYDGILAFGETLSEVYRRWGWADRVFTWHEAADMQLFRPLSFPLAGEVSAKPTEGGRGIDSATGAICPAPPTPLGLGPSRPSPQGGGKGLVWIGNWGDGERSQELEQFLLRPAQNLGLPLDIYGVRYPEAALATVERYGARYRGWLPNARAPEIFAQHLATVHVPRRFYVEHLPGIPTIRVFEALACGIPLVCAPWQDSENLFRPGRDYLVARDGAEMERHLAALRDDADLRASLVESGLATIRARHTCAHRVDELFSILKTLKAGAPLEMSA